MFCGKACTGSGGFGGTVLWGVERMKKAEKVAAGGTRINWWWAPGRFYLVSTRLVIMKRKSGLILFTANENLNPCIRTKYRGLK